MKEKTKKRIQGSVSIFLVIIMLPMICISGLIVDGSRVELAKASVSSAGDLALNSALANYDTVLKDVYGLFATSQSTEDIQKELYKYFTDTLMVNGIISDESDIEENPLLQDIASAFSGKTTNFMSVEVPENEFHVTKLEDSSLANPYVLKNQIVEYQKYRAPIGTALSLLDGIASLKKVLNQGSVNKAKTAVDEKSGEINESGNDLYDALKKYVDAAKSFDPDFDTFDCGGYYNADLAVFYDLDQYSRYKPAFESILPSYIRSIAEAMPFGAYFTKRDGAYSFTGLNFHTQSNGLWGVSWAGQYLGTITCSVGENRGKTMSYTTSLTNDELLDEIRDEYGSFANGAVQDVTRTLIHASDIDHLNLEDKRSVAYAYQIYMKQVRDLFAFYTLYMNQSAVETFSDTVTINYENIVYTESDLSDIFDQAVVFSQRMKSYESDFRNSTAYADALIQNMVSEYSEDLKWFENRDIIGILTTAVSKIEELETKIAELGSLNAALKTEIDKYNGSDQADAFSKQMEGDYEYYKDTISPEKVAALKTKLVSLKTYFTNVKSYLDGIKFVSVRFKELNSLYNMVLMTRRCDVSTGQSVEEYIDSNIGSSLSALKDYLKNEYKEENSCPSKMEVGIDDDEFWLYLQQAFSVEPTEEDNKAKETEDALKENAATSSATNNSTAAYNSIVLSEDIMELLPSNGEYIPEDGPSGYDGEEKFSALYERIQNAVSSLLEGIKKAATAGRDNLYVTDYAFDMFTYNTMEAEYKKKAEKTNNNSEDQPMLIETSSGYAKNNVNNYMYGAEIEYILYGGDNAQKNIKNTKSTIFCIRFLCNSGFALTNAEIKAITLPPALAVQAATFGVVPYKLTQVVFQLCLALAESANDVRRMGEGEKVELIKSGQTWTMSPQGALNAAVDKVKDVAEGQIRNIANGAKGVINDLIDAGADKIQLSTNDFINDMTIVINQQVEEAVGSVFTSFSEELVCSLDGYLKQGKSVVNNAASTAESVVNSAQAKAEAAINAVDEPIRSVLRNIYNSTMSSSRLQDYRTKVQSAISKMNETSAGDILNAIQNEISASISDMVNDMASNISAYTSGLVDDLKSKLSMSANQTIDVAADYVLNVTNDFLDQTFGSLSTSLPTMNLSSANSSALSSVLKFGYGDYLKMFIFLKLCVDDNTVIQRIGDLIQLNLNNSASGNELKHGLNGEFLMSNAYTYVQVEAEVRLKPLFISLPFFTEYAGETGSYFKIDYKSVLGY